MFEANKEKIYDGPKIVHTTIYQDGKKKDVRTEYDLYGNPITIIIRDAGFLYE